MSIRMHNTWLQSHNKQSFQTKKKEVSSQRFILCAQEESNSF